MRTEGHRGEIRRILVALDASPLSRVALEVAANLAIRYQAELVGIYVEDINLIRVADFPFVREIGAISGRLNEINRHLIERQLRAHARFVERLLAEAATRISPAGGTAGESALRWSFRTVRGAISSELLSAARDSDLILLGKSGWSRSRRLGSTARALAAESPILAFILHQLPHPGTPVMVAYDGTPDSRVGMTTARLISGASAELNVLILAEDIESAQRLRTEVEEYFAGEGVKLNYRWLSSLDAETIDQTAQMAGCEVLVLPAESRFLDREALLTILNESKCSVLLVR